MKTREHHRYVRDNIMETFSSCHRALFKPLYRSGRLYPKTLHQPKYSGSRPPKMTGSITGLIKEAAKRPMATVEELQSFTANVGELLVVNPTGLTRVKKRQKNDIDKEKFPRSPISSLP